LQASAFACASLQLYLSMALEDLQNHLSAAADNKLRQM
jgi:hypothetical protein